MEKSNQNKLECVTCNNCSWVHFQVSRANAEKQVEEFNKFYDTLSKSKQQELYGGSGASMDTYLSCFHCGESYKDFHDSTDAEIPLGSTIQPILNRNE